MPVEAELSCDFLAYLQRRLGKSHEATIELLGDWLSRYEPQRGRGSGCSSPLVLTEEYERLSA